MHACMHWKAGQKVLQTLKDQPCPSTVLTCKNDKIPPEGYREYVLNDLSRLAMIWPYLTLSRLPSACLMTWPDNELDSMSNPLRCGKSGSRTCLPRLPQCEWLMLQAPQMQAIIHFHPFRTSCRSSPGFISSLQTLILVMLSRKMTKCDPSLRRARAVVISSLGSAGPGNSKCCKS